MRIKILVVTFLLLAVFSCEFNKSVSKDLTTSLTTKGDGLSCDHVSLSDGTNKINRNSFVYGEKFYLNFNNIKGFEKVKNSVFPGMKLLILGKKGDTVMFSNDLYADNKKGFNVSPLLLQSVITVANPIHSNNEYEIFVNI
ncbi:hypothetical protein Q4Q39_13825 [Flavivirga amylovorans]|uniref:Lipoprotein n=1 Tax=Flavivirga amylovorans TaxID=870486 RepID=A0ABT8X3E5_9FLAO|nr:hypothetical protein [Flavivirga amylovorans]MDO5988487.1 hypothetical protein [Flavivirga amylovorans]